MFKGTKPFVKLVVLLAMSLALLLVASGIQVVMMQGGASVDDPDSLRVMQTIAQLLMFVLPVVLYVLFYESSGKSFLKADFGGRSWLQALVGVVILVLLVPTIDVLANWNDGWHFGEGVGKTIEELLRTITKENNRIVESLVVQDGVGNFVLNLLVIALVPAICEELFFRCGIQQALTEWFRNPHWAIVVAAIIFSLAHGDVFGFVPRVLMGVVLGYLFYYSRSLVVNMCAHFANNAIIVVLYYLNTKGVMDVDPNDLPSIGTVWTCLCFVAAVIAFVVTFVWKGRRKNEVEMK